MPIFGFKCDDENVIPVDNTSVISKNKYIITEDIITSDVYIYSTSSFYTSEFIPTISYNLNTNVVAFFTSQLVKHAILEKINKALNTTYTDLTNFDENFTISWNILKPEITKIVSLFKTNLASTLSIVFTFTYTESGKVPVSTIAVFKFNYLEDNK